jgi:hypothetical protein
MEDLELKKAIEDSLSVKQEEQEGSSVEQVEEQKIEQASEQPAEQESGESIEEYKARVAEYESKMQEYESKLNESKFEYANDTIKKLDELAKNGVEINEDFWKWQSLNIEGYDVKDKSQALELRRMELNLENPDLEPHEVERLLRRSYKALFDNDIDEEDDEYLDALSDLSIDAKKSRAKLTEHKDKIQIPKVDLSKKEEEQRLQKEAYDRFLEDVRTNVTNFKGFEIPLDEGLNINYNIEDPKAKEFLQSAIANDTTFLRDNYVKEGKVDYGRLNRDLTIIRDFEKISKVIYQQGISKGKESMVKDLENPAEQNAETIKDQDQVSSLFAQIAQQFR